MGCWLVAAKKSGAGQGNVVAAQVTMGTKMPLVHRKAKATKYSAALALAQSRSSPMHDESALAAS